MFRKIGTIVLALIVTLTTFNTSFAVTSEMESYKTDKETCIATISVNGVDTQYSLERFITDDSVKTVIRDDNGLEISYAEIKEGILTIKEYSGDLEKEYEFVCNNFMMNVENGLLYFDNYANGSSSISWGSWSSKTETIEIHNLTVAAVLAAISVLCPYTAISAISSAASVLVGGGYKFATVKIRSRYGTDSSYQYAEEEVTIWGRNTRTGTKYNVYGPEVTRQKKSLNS